METVITDWFAAGYVTDEKAWARMYEANAQLEEESPFDPRHVLDRVRLLEWRANMQRLYPVYARENLRAALAGFRELRGMVPSSGFAWAGIAETRARLEQFDDQTVEALAIANRLDPWEDLTLRRIIQAGIGGWQYWPAPTRQLIRDAVGRAFMIDTTLQKEPIDRFVFDTAIRYRWEDELIALIPDKKRRIYFQALRRQRQRP